MTTETTQREKIKITKQEAIDAVDGLAPEGYTIEADKPKGSSRWHETWQIVLKRESDGKLFADTYRQGLTECQDSELWEYTDPDFTEVFPVEKTVIVYQ